NVLVTITLPDKPMALTILPNLHHALRIYRQIYPLTAGLTGNVAGVIKLFNRCDWHAEPESGASLPHQFTLMAGQGVSGKD
ncbi:hypothetical protein N4236_20940, partial [Enterobacter asburiae]|nr:hypothetical protein [Enterobacter asburiae]